MKKSIFLLAAFMLTVSVFKSQNNLAPITGNYIGQQFDYSITTIKVKKNHQYILRIYDKNGKFEKKVKGSWILEEHQLTLTEKSGLVTIIQKYEDALYIPSETGFTAKVRFYAFEGNRRSFLKARGC